jgi:type I restriction enzyme R subunit
MGDNLIIHIPDLDLGLVELIVEQGLGGLEKLPEGIRHNPEATLETIENNIRKVIIDEQPVNPMYYENMSELLDALIQERKIHALEYKEYLAKLVELSSKVKNPAETSAYPGSLSTPAMRALYDNVDRDEAMVIRIDTVVRYTRRDDWRGNRVKEREVLNAIREELGASDAKADQVVEEPA